MCFLVARCRCITSRAMFHLCGLCGGGNHPLMRHSSAVKRRLRRIRGRRRDGLTYPSFGHLSPNDLSPDYQSRHVLVRLMTQPLRCNPTLFRGLAEMDAGRGAGRHLRDDETSGTVRQLHNDDSNSALPALCKTVLMGLECAPFCKDGTRRAGRDRRDCVVRGFSVSRLIKGRRETRAAFQDGWFIPAIWGPLDAAGSDDVSRGGLKDMPGRRGECAALEIERA